MVDWTGNELDLPTTFFNDCSLRGFIIFIQYYDFLYFLAALNSELFNTEAKEKMFISEIFTKKAVCEALSDVGFIFLNFIFGQQGFFFLLCDHFLQFF